jgi:hypothetical protein
MGTDSYYYPLIEITKDKTIRVTDSLLKTEPSGFKTIESENGDLVIVQLGENYLLISESIFKINNNGMIEGPIIQFKSINLSDCTKNKSIEFSTLF